MTKKLWLCTLFLALAPAVGVRAQSTGLTEVTLHSPRKDAPSFVNFLTGETASAKNTAARGRWDLGYGTLRVNEDLDWFRVSTAEGSRTAVRDLGALGWDDSFDVPVVEPFPVLKDGGRRVITVNADGADGKPGRSAGLASPSDASLVESSITRAYIPAPEASTGGPGYSAVITPSRVETPPAKHSAPRPRRDGVPKVDPVFVKAVAGHIYAVHVVDGGEDFYVLFRAESLVRGDSCKISWKRVPAPAAGSASR